MTSTHVLHDQDGLAMPPTELGLPAEGIWGTLGFIATAVISGALWFRNKMSKDSTTRAADRSELSTIEMLQRENARYIERNDQLETKLMEANMRYNDLHREKSLVEAQVTLLADRVSQLEATIHKMNAEGRVIVPAHAASAFVQKQGE